MIRRFEWDRIPLALIGAGAILALLLVFYQLAELGLLFLSLPLLFGVVAGLVILRYPWAGFALLLMSVPIQRLGAEGGPLPVTLTQLAFPAALVGLAIGVLGNRSKLRGHVALIPFVALFAIMIASALVAKDVLASLAELARWGVALATFWLALQFIVDESDRRLVGVVGLIVAGGVFEATIGVVQSVLGFGPFELQSGVSRAFGTFGKPNSYAGFLEMALFPAAWLGVWYAGSSWQRLRMYRADRLQGMDQSRASRMNLLRGFLMTVFLLGSAALILSGILASLSRGAWLGVVAGALATALLFGRVARILVFTLVVAAATVIIGGQTWLLPSDFRERISDSVEQIRPFDASNVTITDDNFAAAERVAHWQAGIDMFQDHPALGIGIGNFNSRYEEYSVRETFRNSQGHAHNYYIHTLAETGMLGFLAYLTLLGTIVSIAIGTLISGAGRGTMARAVVLGALGSIIAVSTHNLVENLHVLNLGITISLLWALVIAGHRRVRFESLELGQQAR